MDIEDLRKFLVAAQRNNLQTAAEDLNVTPSALSKIIKRLENKLETHLFERKGRGIQLNQHGDKFRQYALHLVHEADQAISEFNGTKSKTMVKISGPSILLQHYFSDLLTHWNDDQLEFNLDACWEGSAINQVATGQTHVALVTAIAINESNHNLDFERIKLGTTQFKVVASGSHPILQQFSDGKLTSQQLHQYGFACPSVSPFCGVKRGVGSDGWRDDKMSRTIGYRCNDFSVLMSLVNDGKALAYVPDFVAHTLGLSMIEVVDCDYHCQEQIELVYKPSMAHGWLNRLIETIKPAELL